MNEHVDYQSKKAKSGTKFLWWCAGADAEILKYSSYSDHVKYAGIGGVVLATGFMAALSMGFAMHTIFTDAEGNGNWFITIPISIAWALIVFNLDRFIVSSTGKGDGESSISGKELLNATPRLLMAILLGLTISAPLETFIFDKEIQREWRLSMDQLAIAKTYEIYQTEAQKNSENEKFFQEAKEQVRIQQEKYDIAYKEYQDELSGKNKANGYGEGRVSAAKLIVAKTEEVELNKRRRAMDSLSKITGMNQDKIKHMQDSVLQETKAIQPGFLDKLMMIERLSSSGKTVPKADPATGKPIEGSEVEIYSSAFWPIWLVRLLFMIVEIAPVLLKLMLIKGPYDYMSENVNQILETKQGISIYHMKDEQAQLHKLKRNHNPERIISIIEHQNEKEAENAKEAITAFAEKEKEQIKNNPDDFIKPTT